MGRVYTSPLRDTVRRVIELEGPVSAATISDRLGKRHGALARQLRHLRDMGEVRISEWQEPPSRGRWAPLYSIGSGRDAPPPTYPERKEHSRTYRAKRWPEIRSRAQARAGRPVVAATWLSGLL